MHKGLQARIQLVKELAGIYLQVVEQVQPGTPTKALEVVGILKQALGVLAGRFTDPEPTPVTVTEEQKLLAQMGGAEVRRRSAKLAKNIVRLDAVAFADYASHPIAEWTNEQKAQVREYIEGELAALTEAIESL